MSTGPLFGKLLKNRRKALRKSIMGIIGKRKIVPATVCYWENERSIFAGDEAGFRKRLPVIAEMYNLPEEDIAQARERTLARRERLKEQEDIFSGLDMGVLEREVSVDALQSLVKIARAYPRAMTVGEVVRQLQNLCSP